MRPTAPRTPRATALWILVILGLLALRVPALVEPAGNDQSLYMYVADRVRAGGVPYVDAWDQKPPAVFFVYAAVRSVWADESAVGVADLVAAALTAMLLVQIGGRALGGRAGWLAAAVFLLFSHPSIARLSGIYVRGQCETFIALAVTAAMAATWRRQRTPVHLLFAGVWLAAAFWLKYNAVTCAAPIALALVVGRDDARAPVRRTIVGQAPWIAAGALAASAVVLTYFASHGALDALRVATIDYNLRYAGETYTAGAGGAVAYIAGLPLDRAKAELLWYLGLAGLVLLVGAGWRRERPSIIILAAWLMAAVLAIAINGARGLPQYFVQASPVLALAAAAGFVTAFRQGRLWQVAAGLLLVVGVWRVGTDARTVAGLRWGGLPQLIENVGFDLRYMRGAMPRAEYLARFKGQQKYDAAAMEALSLRLARATTPDDRILVFGFAPGVYLNSGRQSATRFFWSRPVVLEFAAGTPGYGSAGLLAELIRTPPAMIALQKQDWGPGDPNSEAFFLGTPSLRDWLSDGYVLDSDTPLFSVWKRSS